MTETILTSGVAVPMPYSLFFDDPIPGSVFKVDPNYKPEKCTEGYIWCTLDWVAKLFGFPAAPKESPFPDVVKAFAGPMELDRRKLVGEMPAAPQLGIMVPPALAAAATAANAAKTSVEGAATAAQNVATDAVNAAQNAAAGAANTAQAAQTATTGAVNAAANTAQAAAKQGGGGHTEPAGPGPVIAGALTALVVAGGLKGFYDFISKQYG